MMNEIEVMSYAIAVPVGGLTFIAFLMICDVLGGIFKAIALKRGLRSTIGTNGLIRKAGVMLALLVFIVIDSLIEINFIAFVPADILAILDIEKVGLSHVMISFFALFEVVSLFENLGEIGVPLPRFIMKFIERLKITFEGEN